MCEREGGGGLERAPPEISFLCWLGEFVVFFFVNWLFLEGWFCKSWTFFV